MVVPAAFLLVTCSGGDTRETGRQTAGPAADSVVGYHRQVVEAERTEIEDFIARYQWKMETTPTGLRWMVYRPGKGRTPKEGDIVSIRYRITLLNGEPVTRQGTGELSTFELGRKKAVGGLEEGLMHMQQGAKAHLIVPAHLAYGLLGDPSGVPAGATLVYDVELISLADSR